MHIPAPGLPPPVINTGHTHTTTHPDVLHIQISPGMEDVLHINIPRHGRFSCYRHPMTWEDVLPIDIPWHGKMPFIWTSHGMSRCSSYRHPTDDLHMAWKMFFT
jgi:hypothetical protein